RPRRSPLFPYTTLFRSARQQQLVAQGQIAPGMSENAVWLAWGSPGQRVNGFARGHSTETWVYFGYTNAYPYGYGYGGFGYGYPGDRKSTRLNSSHRTIS